MHFFSIIPIYMGPTDCLILLQGNLNTKTQSETCYYICFLTYGNHKAEKGIAIDHLLKKKILKVGSVLNVQY